MNAWLRKAFLGWLSWAAVVLCVALPVSADETLLMQAAKKWEVAELTEAAKLYQQALDEGGLYPSDVLVAYTRIGTVQAATNQQNLALSSFRVAASIDPSFELPSEAGKKAQALYKKARAEAEKSGGKLEITAEVPTSSQPGQAFSVEAHMATAYVALIQDVGITVRDPSVPSMKPFTAKKPASEAVAFEVPGKVVIAGANLLVRVDALDAHGNRWASSESRVKVGQRPVAAPILEKDPDDDAAADKGKKDKKGFWASPWPWVIGGAVVVGSVAGYFMFRPTDEVTVSAPAWR